LFTYWRNNTRYLDQPPALFEWAGTEHRHKNKKRNSRRSWALTKPHILYIHKKIGMHLSAWLPAIEIRNLDRSASTSAS